MAQTFGIPDSNTHPIENFSILDTDVIEGEGFTSIRYDLVNTVGAVITQITALVNEGVYVHTNSIQTFSCHFGFGDSLATCDTRNEGDGTDTFHTDFVSYFVFITSTPPLATSTPVVLPIPTPTSPTPPQSTPPFTSSKTLPNLSSASPSLSFTPSGPSLLSSLSSLSSPFSEVPASTPSSNSDSASVHSNSSSLRGSMIGGTVGGILAFLIFFLLCVILLRRMRLRVLQKELDPEPYSGTSSDKDLPPTPPRHPNLKIPFAEATADAQPTLATLGHSHADGNRRSMEAQAVRKHGSPQFVIHNHEVQEVPGSDSGTSKIFTSTSTGSGSGSSSNARMPEKMSRHELEEELKRARERLERVGQPSFSVIGDNPYSSSGDMRSSGYGPGSDSRSRSSVLSDAPPVYQR